MTATISLWHGLEYGYTLCSRIKNSGILNFLHYKKIAFCGNSLFWLYYLKKDCSRFNVNYKNPTDFWQHKVVVGGKVVGDSLRLFDVVGTYYFPETCAKICPKAREIGLFLGGVDAVREQVLVFRKIQDQGLSVSRVFKLASNIFFASFSFGSVIHPKKPLSGFAQPKMQVGLMIGAIACAVLAKKWEGRTKK